MKFYGEPNLSVMSNKEVGFENVRYKLCKFDENGEFETDNQSVIAKMAPNFKHDETKKHKCPKCGDQFDNMGLMLAHIRKLHPKGE